MPSDAICCRLGILQLAEWLKLSPGIICTDVASQAWSSIKIKRKFGAVGSVCAVAGPMPQTSNKIIVFNDFMINVSQKNRTSISLLFNHPICPTCADAEQP